MNFIELHIITSAELAEILLAELTNLPFDTFQEEEDGLRAYTEEDKFLLSDVEDIINRYRPMGEINFQVNKIEKVNWNQEWESNFEPIIVADKILVRATFHKPDSNYPYEIVIQPKMSFGTGHHDTTYQMLQAQLLIDHQSKSVIDAGTGTGILAIMAHKLGAAQVLANDIDEWCVSNSEENYALNNCSQIETQLGTIEVFRDQKVDILLANINKNVLLGEIQTYSNLLHKGGSLVLSGFYEHDVDDVLQEAARNGLLKKDITSRNKWACLTCIKE